MGKIAIIGAGASGMMAAIEAARCGAKVTLFEKNDRVGKKILATGNGKCNLSNLDFGMEHYYCSDKSRLEQLFGQFSVRDTISFFETMGLIIRDKSGYLYPYSEQAASVLDTLRMEVGRLGIDVITDSEIKAVTYQEAKSQFELSNTAGDKYLFPQLIIACGSPASQKKGEGLSGYEMAEKLGHRVNKVVPGLVQLKSEDGFIKGLAGVRCQAAVKLIIDGKTEGLESGELQFTEYGISGIPVFQFSRTAAYAFEAKRKVQAQVDFFPNVTRADFLEMTRKRFMEHKEKTLEQFLTGTANKKINLVMIKQAGLKPDTVAAQAGEKAVMQLMQQYREFPIHLTRANTLDKAQICAGGVDLSQVTEQMESRWINGLFFAGELLDVDGKCGGYNLQWAWTSGYIAGRSAAIGKAK